MPAPTNVLQAVKTISGKATIMVNNSGPVFNRGDKQFDNFQTRTAQLGSSVSYMKQPRATVVRSLKWQEQSNVQRIQNLTVNKPFSASSEYTDEEVLFNVDPINWDKSWIKAAIVNLGSELEQEVSKDFTIYPYRYYGDGRTPITTFSELNTILMRFRNFGAVSTEGQFFLPDFAVPSIVQSGLNQFAIDRNNTLANSWELAKYSNCNFMASNQLQMHTAGSEGQANSTLTVSAVTKDSAGFITDISFTGTSASNDTNSVKAGDRFTITTSSTYLLQFVGYNKSVNQIQFMADDDAAAVSGTVTVHLRTPLYPGKSISDAISINTDITVGMTANVADSHIAACLYAGQAHQIANPALPNQSPFDTSWGRDTMTGCSVRITHGAQIGEGTIKLGIDSIVGSTMNPDLCMTVCFPLNQG